VHYPLRDGALINVVLAMTEPCDGGSASDVTTRAGGDLARDLAARGAAPELCALIAAGESWRRWPFFARPALTRWSYGAVTLLGDAAHPMPPFLAQGAAQAIEDAEALGRAFAGAPDAPVARIFAAYEQARIARASRVARASRRQGDLDHLGGLAAAVRDLGIRALGGRGLLLRNAWLYR
jgi:salicylate hydroxylase